MITFSEVKKYVKSIEIELNTQLSLLENFCIEGRDRKVNPIPLYLTKWRVKKAESVYLKTKRKNTDLGDISDYGGFRLLCLYEKEVYPIHEFFLKNLKKYNYEIKECKIYNWREDHYSKLSTPLNDIFPNCNPTQKTKVSGYKSIHYIINRKNNALPIEVQLRTLVQDVWGELEHSLAYKRGSVHPHIRKSFYLLSKDLENIDNLLSHLRDISEKEQCGDRYSSNKVGPNYYFFYESEIFPQAFQQDGQLKDIYGEYDQIIENEKTNNLNDPWVPKAFCALDKFDDIVTRKDEKDDPNLTYWLQMEKAYLFFCKTDYETSLTLYLNILQTYPNKYCVHYRIGELHILLGDIAKGLASFDEAERLLVEESIIDHLNHYRIKSRLALVYWSLGEEYIDIALKEINEAEELFKQHKEIHNLPYNEQTLANNLCWYNLEKYIIAQKNDAPNVEELFKNAEDKFKQLKMLADSTEDPSSNSFDTIAWFYFYKYKKERNMIDLNNAKNYCKIMGDKFVATSFNFRSINIHINHVQEIMNAS